MHVFRVAQVVHITRQARRQAIPKLAKRPAASREPGGAAQMGLNSSAMFRDAGYLKAALTSQTAFPVRRCESATLEALRKHSLPTHQCPNFLAPCAVASP